MKYLWTLGLAALVLAPCGALSAQDTTTPPQPADNSQVEQTVQEQIDALQKQLDVLKESVNEPEGGIQTTVSDVRKLKKIKVSGYVQSRYEIAQDAKSVAAGGDSKNKIYVRRARIKVTGAIGSKTQAVAEIDASGASAVTKTAYVEYDVMGDAAVAPSVSIGQMLWPFGYELTRSSSVREAPEYSRVVATLFPGEYDRGIKFASATNGPVFCEFGLFNGTGYKQNPNDNDQVKDLVGRVRYEPTPNFTLGLSGYSGKQVIATTPAIKYGSKTRYGFDAQLYLPETTLTGEYITGNELVAGSIRKVNGWYAQASRNLTPVTSLVVKYEVYDDKNHDAKTQGVLKTWNYGIIRALDEATRLKLFYEVDQEERNAIANNKLIFEVVSIF